MTSTALFTKETYGGAWESVMLSNQCEQFYGTRRQDGGADVEGDSSAPPFCSSRKEIWFGVVGGNLLSPSAKTYNQCQEHQFYHICGVGDFW